MSEQLSVTKNIKVSNELAERLAYHGGFHATYADIITALLDFYEKQRPGSKAAEDVNKQRKVKK